MENHLDATRLIMTLLFKVICNVFLCMIGDTVTTKFSNIDATLCACSLNEFPSEIRKMFPMVLAMTQKPVHIEGFMNVQCTREVLKKVKNLFAKAVEEFKAFICN